MASQSVSKDDNIFKTKTKDFKTKTKDPTKNKRSP